MYKYERMAVCFNKEISPSIFRKSYISSNAVILESLGIIGNCLLEK